MKYFVLVPPSYGQLGEQTVFDKPTAPRKPIRLRVMLEYPPAEDLMSVGGDNYLVTQSLATGLSAADLGGYELVAVDVFKGDQFDIVSPQWKDHPVPKLRWFKITGTGLRDHFGLHQNRLVVSESALSLLRKFKIHESEITPVETFPFSWEDRKQQLFDRARERLKARGLGKPEW